MSQMMINKKQDALGDGRLRAQCHLANRIKHGSSLISAISIYLCENMTPFTKPEVHNVLHCCQRRTEPRSRVTSTENLVKFRPVVLLNMQSGRETDKQTDIQTR